MTFIPHAFNRDLLYEHCRHGPGLGAMGYKEARNMNPVLNVLTPYVKRQIIMH